MLYTVIDENEIFFEDKKTEYSYKRLDNCILEGVKYNNGIMLTRVISTNLQDYLNPDYQIGRLISIGEKKNKICK